MGKVCINVIVRSFFFMLRLHVAVVQYLIVFLYFIFSFNALVFGSFIFSLVFSMLCLTMSDWSVKLMANRLQTAAAFRTQKQKPAAVPQLHSNAAVMKPDYLNLCN